VTLVRADCLETVQPGGSHLADVVDLELAARKEEMIR
jgi:hypothetical protein